MRPDNIHVAPINTRGLNSHNLAQQIVSSLAKAQSLPYDRFIIRKEDGATHIICEEAEYEWPFAVCEIVKESDIRPFWLDVVNHYTLGVYSQ